MNRILLIFCLFTVSVIHAQVQEVKRGDLKQLKEGQLNDSLGSNRRDFGNTSNKNIKNKDAKIIDYKIISVENDTIIADTTLTIRKDYKFNYLRKDYFDILPFSNIGQTFNTLSYNFSDNRLMPNFGARAMHFNYKEINDIYYYYVPTPFTELMYKTAFEQGQLLESMFTVNTSQQFNFSVGYKGLRSLGKYQHILTSTGNFYFSTNYKAKNERYNFRAHFTAQDLLNDQNGGIKDEDIESFESGNPEFLDRSVFDPAFENANSVLKGNRYYLEHAYNLIQQKDSTNQNILSIGNTFSYEDKGYKFEQTSQNDFFGDAFLATNLRDRVSLQDMYIDVNAKYINSTIGVLKFKAAYNKYNYGYNKIVTLNGNDITNRLKGNVISVGGEYQNRIGEFEVEGKFGLNISGGFDGNFLSGNASYNINDDIEVVAGININSRAPNYNYLLYQSDYVNYNWQNDFSNVETKQLSFQLKSDKLANIEVDYSTINDYTYFSLSEVDTLVKPFQNSNTINYFRVKLEKGINWRNFTLDNTIRYQKVIDGEGVLNVPEIVTRNTLYYSNHLFKKALFLQTGITFNYFTKYNMNAYDPLLAEFYTQNQTKLGGFPRLDFFINAKIQQTRIFIKAEHINSAFTGYNYYSAPNYPYRDFAIRFGLVWNFFL
ncbi:MAG: hypothetical protein DA407_06400 [Bacteroidetes bacterium]|nr:MAG: hypothetical protein DA407_06400 [Bacteroidota bacterium]